MSVVNKMLQDLETRQQQQPPGANYQPPAKRRYGWWIFGVLPLALIVAVVYWLWPLFRDADWPGHPPVQTTQSPSVPETRPVGNDTGSGQPAAGSEQPQHTAIVPQQQEQQPPATGGGSEQSSTTPSPATAQINDTDKPVQNNTPGQSEPEIPATKPPAFTKTRAATTTGQRWQQLKADVSTAMADGRDTEAIAGLEIMLQLQPQNHQVRRHLAALLLKNGAPGHSELLLEQGVEQYPQALPLRESLARLYAQISQPAKALTLLKGRNPDVLLHPDYIQLRARLAQQLQDHQQAQLDYALLSRFQPESIKWRLGLAVALDQDGQYQAAVEVYRWLAGATTTPDIGAFVQQRLAALGG